MKDKKTLLWLVLPQILMLLVFSVNLGWFQDLGTLIGMVVTPLLASIISFAIGTFGVTLNIVNRKHLGVFILTSVLVSEFLFMVGLHSFGPDLVDLKSKRVEYQKAVEFDNSLNQEIKAPIEKIIPSDWKIEGVISDKGIYWFSALEYSYQKGYDRYIGYYKSPNENQVLSVEQIWSKIIELKGFSQKTRYEFVYFTLDKRRLYFEPMGPPPFYIKLEIENGKIVVKNLQKLD